MRNLFLTILIFLFTVAPVFGDTVRLAWEQDVPSDMAGWKLYVENATMPDCKTSNLADNIEYTGQTEYTTTYQVTGVAGDTFYFQLTAYDTSGNESDCSNEVSYVIPDTTPPDAPFNLTIEVVVTPPQP